MTKAHALQAARIIPLLAGIVEGHDRGHRINIMIEGAPGRWRIALELEDSGDTVEVAGETLGEVIQAYAATIATKHSTLRRRQSERN